MFPYFNDQYKFISDSKKQVLRKSQKVCSKKLVSLVRNKLSTNPLLALFAASVIFILSACAGFMGNGENSVKESVHEEPDFSFTYPASWLIGHTEGESYAVVFGGRGSPNIYVYKG